MSAAIDEFVVKFASYGQAEARAHLESLDDGVRTDLLLSLINSCNLQRDKLIGVKDLASQIIRV